MNVINITNGPEAVARQTAAVAKHSASNRSSAAAFAQQEDRVEFSNEGRALARAVRESSFRIARIRSIRSELATGVFETRQRIDGTVSRMLDELA